MLRHVQKSLRAAVLVAVSASVVVPSGAGAVNVTRIYAGPITAASACNPEGSGATPARQAAAYADFCFALRAEKAAAGGDDLRTTVIDSPPGVLANVDQAPQCLVANFAARTTAAAKCAVSTQVGAATATIRAQIAPGVEIPLNVKGRVYDLQHTTNEVGLLGIQLDPVLAGVALPKSKITLRFTLRPSPDVGLRAVADGLPRYADSGLGFKLPIAIDTFGFRFWGSRADHPTMPVSFSRTGSSCDTATTRFTADSYAGDHSALEATYAPTGCDQLAIGQTATLRSSERRPDVPTETQVEIAPTKPADPDHQATVNAGQSIVTLPPGLMLGAQGASGPGGLPLCSNAQFGLTTNAAPACPAASATATVKFVSPNLKVPFTGKAYLGEQTGPNRLPQLMISVDQGGTAADAPRVKLLGQLTIDRQGRLVTTLSGLPDVPFDSFQLTFRGGTNGVTSTPRSCGTGAGTSVLTPYSAQSKASTAALTLTIDQDCVDPAAFSPSLAASFASTAAGADGSPTFIIARPDRTARLGKATVHLAPGMLASLKGVPECSAADAAAASCQEASRVGSVTVQAGVGPAPYTAPKGAVYLTQRPAGAVAALSIAAPVAFGGVNLGTLVVPARIDLRQGDLGLDLTTDVPQTFLDIPLNIRAMAVALDRPGFSRNPTSCGPLTVSADLTSDLGGSASPSAGAQMTGCSGLAFNPQVAASLPAGTKSGDSAGVNTDVALPGVQSALQKVVVTLPEGIAADLTKLTRACPIADFRAGTCADVAVTGTASGRLAIIDEPIAGRVLLVKYPNETLPGIALDLTGRFSAKIEGHVKVASTGRLQVTLDGLPDAPIDDLALAFTPGAPSALKVSSAFCSSGTTAFDFELVGQSGATAKRTITQSCGAGGVLGARTHRSTITAKLSGRKSTKPTLNLKITGPSGTKFTAAQVLLGAGLSVPKARRNKISLTGGRVRVSGQRTLRVALTGTGRRTLALRLRGGTLGSTASLRRSKARIPIRITLRYADGVVERRTVRVR